MSVANAAKIAFSHYAGMNAPDLPENPSWFAAIQVNLARWQSKNFGPANAQQMALGICEEAGELAHAVLKRSQGIRGMDDDDAYLDAVADAIADVVIYCMQMATLHRLDFATLVALTAGKVMARDWTANPEGEGV